MIVVITNKGAGIGGNSKASEIREVFKVLGVDVDVVEVDGSELSNAARAAVAKGAEVVVAAGGDGTVNTVVSALVGTATPLGVLPMGTLNHFAKDAGIPLVLADAAALIVGGSKRAIDVAAVNSRIFINNSSIGLYPLMVRDRDKQRSKLKRSKWWAMIVASAAIFKKFPTFDVRMTIDGKKTHYETPAVFVGNNMYKLDVLNLGTRDSLMAGVLSVYGVRTRTSWRTFRLIFQILFSRVEENKLFDVAHAEELILETKRKTIDVSLDGEVVKMETPLRYEIRKLSLQVMLPSPA